MRQYCKRIFSCLLLLGMLASIFCGSAFATSFTADSQMTNLRDSAYLNSYRAVLVADSGGELICNVAVNAAVNSDKVGATDIYILESTDGVYFQNVSSLHRNYQDYPIMMGSGYIYNEDCYTFTGTIGHYYRANVWVYAEKNGGSDTRLYTTAAVLCHS